MTSFGRMGLSRVDTTRYPGWSEITFTVDSGAPETVIGLNALTAVPLVQGQAAKNGVKYECANGAVIKNLGQKQFVGTWFAGESDGRCISRPMVAQVTSVNKALLSVAKTVAAGNRIVFDDESYIEDKTTGERMYLHEVNGMYMMRMWVKSGEGF